jgi:hypothetical protein
VALRFGAWLVAARLAGIIVNLLTFTGYFDIALRDYGLLVGSGVPVDRHLLGDPAVPLGDLITLITPYPR